MEQTPQFSVFNARLEEKKYILYACESKYQVKLEGYLEKEYGECLKSIPKVLNRKYSIRKPFGWTEVPIDQDTTYVKGILKCTKKRVLSVNNIVTHANNIAKERYLKGKFIVIPILCNKIKKPDENKQKNSKNDESCFRWDHSLIKKLFPTLNMNYYEYEDKAEAPAEPMEEEEEKLEIMVVNPKIVRRKGIYKPPGVSEDLYSHCYFVLHTANSGLRTNALAITAVFVKGPQFIRVCLCDYLGFTHYIDLKWTNEKDPTGLAVFPRPNLKVENIDSEKNFQWIKDFIGAHQAIIGWNLDSIIRIFKINLQAKNIFKFDFENVQNCIQLPTFSLETMEFYAMATMILHRLPEETGQTLKKITLPSTSNANIFAFLLETRYYPWITELLGFDLEYFPLDYEPYPRKRGRIRKAAIVNYYGHVVLNEVLKPWEYSEESNREPDEEKKKKEIEDRQSRVKNKIRDILLSRDDIIVVGQSVEQDLQIAGLSNFIPEGRRKDLATKIHNLRSSSKLRDSASYCLNLAIQDTHDHDPVEDSLASMALYRWLEDQWDKNGCIQIPLRLKKDDPPPTNEKGYAYYRE